MVVVSLLLKIRFIYSFPTPNIWLFKVQLQQVQELKINLNASSAGHCYSPRTVGIVASRETHRVYEYIKYDHRVRI